jgi:NADH:ubiquinone oxidoreductase subunit F (NADH-binding)
VTALAVEPEQEALRLLGGLRCGRALSLDEHLAQHGSIDLGRRESLRAMLEASGLQGRGGGGFPVARKVAAVVTAHGRPSLVVNATEGEPLSHKDKFLLRHAPHLVLDGAIALASDIGASSVVVALADRARVEREALEVAVAERAALRIDGRIQIHAAAVPDSFVAGEETALISHLNGGAAKPTFTPPRPFERGLHGRPTLVQNAETAAHVALIARKGPDWFRELGTYGEPGSALFTLSGAVRRPGVYEAGIGIPLQELVEIAGGLAQQPQAVLVGGYFGTWFTAREAAGLTMDDASLRARGGGLGARAVAVLPHDGCGVEKTVRIAGYLAAESAGQCGPCVHGLAAIVGALDTTARGKDQRDRISRWCGQVTGRGACRHPDGAVRFVASALDVFAEDFTAHAEGRCLAR